MASSASASLIVNADDFGMSHSVNGGIVLAHQEGVVTSASMMATGDAWDEAVTTARRLPGLGIGVHLSWVDGRPVTDPSRVSTLVDRSGRLLSSWPAFLLRYLRGRIDYDEVEREAVAQIEKMLARGIRPDHVDSHQHLHVLPGIFERVVKLGVRYDIPVVRLPREPMIDLWGDLARWPGLMRRWALRGVLSMRVADLPDGVRCADACLGVGDSCHLTEARLLRVLRSVPTGVTEVMCHPGLAADAAGHRQEELAALTSQAVREAIEQRGLTLTTFAACAERSAVGFADA